MSENRPPQIEHPGKHGRNYRIDVAPSRALLDEPVAIKLSGFDPERPVTVRAQTKDGGGKRWASAATFVAGRDGTVDLTAQAPIAGGYTGVHPMGLFWSMLPQDGALAFSTTQDFSVALEAEAEGKILASAVIERLSPLSEKTMRHEELSENGLVGTLYYRAADEPRAAIIVLGGADGEFQSERASLLAAHGYVALDLAYFGRKTLPRQLVKIPLEYIGGAVQWLKSNKVSDPGRIGVIGKSFGGQLALLAAACYSDIRAVVAEGASSLIWHSPVPSQIFRPAWTTGGKGLPYVREGLRETVSLLFQLCVGKKQIRLFSCTQSALRKVAAVKKAAIPVEKIDGSVLLISGKDDRLWPSSRMSDAMIERLRECRFPYEYLHFSYEDAGHDFGGGMQRCSIPYLPPSDLSEDVFVSGGTRQGNAVAAAQAWPVVLQFFERHLGMR